MIRTLVVHEVSLIADLMAKALSGEKEIQVVNKVHSADEALAQLATCDCDVVLVNILLPDDGAHQLARTISRDFGEVRVVITGLLDSKTVALQCLEMGAAGYIHQDESVDDLISKVRCAKRGEALLSPQVAGALVARLAELKRLATELNGYCEMNLQDQCATLTAREREILELIGKGYSNQQIADELVIGVGTVKNHVHKVLEKLDVHTRKQAAMIARQMVSGTAPRDGELYTWPEDLGVQVNGRREAAALLDLV
jgi:DNA-binding NarL/FixJ family response regulator